ncbi:ferric reductase transmembrane component 3 [Verticillium alfalfae VaMs.102]|uniref:ferric-chelate reductase (NADPH) n=1 Tax=Verticillium alfalfae (strain VaMs.102 / ATCC MYA-4576 / FGSC 10136) TaxID=526221 RepID=C9SR58_VERA1|nr:ferric reductase transmembrane component 3 [Verticillium alfalfae VaMs.102]EEY20860.1 ferric reductase transmembrane component 3 [Verticillium alfalfae VaMs.102]
MAYVENSIGHCDEVAPVPLAPPRSSEIISRTKAGPCGPSLNLLLEHYFHHGPGKDSPEEIAPKAAASALNASLSNYLYYRYFRWRHRTKLFVLQGRNVMYAPIFSKRHKPGISAKAVPSTLGTLPTRLQLGLLVWATLLCSRASRIDIPFAATYDDAARAFRNRTGVLAVVNMIPLFLMAARNNPLINLLGISFDTFNLLHRWFGRIVILEAIAHTMAFMSAQAHSKSWEAGFQTVLAVPSFFWGFLGTCGFCAIFIQAWSPIRHAFYEIFKLLHIVLAILAVMGTWYHLHLKDLPQLRYLIAAIVIWAVDRLWRVFRVIYGNFGRGGSQALVEALPGNAVRVTVNMARPWTFRPGQHAYMYMPSLSYLQSHPFSVAWSEDAEDLSSEKLTMNRQDILEMRKTTISFVIRGRTGFTNTLLQKASACPRGQMHTTCMVEGPYGELHNMKSYGTVMLFAGGVGITQAVPHVRDLVIGYANGTVATRRITLVWVIQSPEHLEWIRPWMTQILAMDKRRDVLRIMLFVSRPRSSKEIHSPSATVQMFPGRPNIDTLLAAEMEQQVGALGVTVCGPGVLSDDVRRAVRRSPV